MEYAQFRTKLRVKCVPGLSEEEFDGLVERIARSAAESEGRAASAVADSLQLREQRCARCSNSDPACFYFDGRSGDTVCLGVQSRCRPVCRSVTEPCAEAAAQWCSTTRWRTGRRTGTSRARCAAVVCVAALSTRR